MTVRSDRGLTDFVAPPSLPEMASLRDYKLRPGSRDEFVNDDGSPRPHWATLLRSLDTLGQPEFRRRWHEALDLIRENGVTYNVYGDPNGMDRIWQLDPLPVVIPANEWATVEAGLIQRATLLEAVLADIYGPQDLLRQGLLPPELIFDHPGFLRPCHGLPLPGKRSLFLYAADLARGPDGNFHVLRDRTQAPSGAGYALENRIVLSRMLPEAFRECRVQRLALFFRNFKDTLRAVAPRNRDNPRIVLLTPGPYNETYFEHAYLARYLGYTLVEGGDLTVRDNRVYLKLLGGLQPVDVIFRRLDDDFCDPLELRGDSFLGVPGLVQALRAGNVAVANSLGSGLIESPAFMAFLPALCRHLFHEELKLPSAPTWWLGDATVRQAVYNRFDRMVVKPAYGTVRMTPQFVEKLTAAQRQSLIERIEANPRLYIAQEKVPLSACPVFREGRYQSRHLGMRAYLTASEDSFTVMPGGLTRVTATPDSMSVSMQEGGGSKDTWVLAAGEVHKFTLLRPTLQAVELSRGGGDLPSRVADNLFWLGRYVERAEAQVRLLRGILVRMTEKLGLGEIPELPLLLRALTLQTRALPGFVGVGGEARIQSPEPELLAMIYDTRRPGSLADTLHAVHRVAGTARDRISQDMWRIVGSLELRQLSQSRFGDLKVDPQDARRTLSDALDLLNGTIITLSAFGGLAMDSMTRGQAWRFLDMGRRLERALNVASFLNATLVPPNNNEAPLLEAILEVADSSMTYRRRYLGSLETAPVLDLLLADESNPRSLAFQLITLSDSVDNLPREGPELPGRSPEQRMVLSLLTALRLTDIDTLSQTGALGRRVKLDELTHRIEAELPQLSDTITRRFLSHLQTSRHLGTRFSWEV